MCVCSVCWENILRARNGHVDASISRVKNDSLPLHCGLRLCEGHQRTPLCYDALIKEVKEEDASISEHRGGSWVCVGGSGVCVRFRSIGGNSREHIVRGKLVSTGGFSSVAGELGGGGRRGERT